MNSYPFKMNILSRGEIESHRFDLCYTRNHKTTDTSSTYDFFNHCTQIISQKRRNVKLKKNVGKGWILKIGHRRSLNCSRMYERENSVRFELEMKKKFLQKYFVFFMDHPLHSFEDQLSFHYLRYFGKLLPLEDSYTDWLVERVRALPKFQRLTAKSYLYSHYVTSHHFQSFEGRTHFFHLLQFLRYVQNLDYRIDQLGTTSFRLCVFRVQDFLTYLDPKVRPTNYYQFKKVLLFFNALQKNSILQSFSDTEFRSLVTIPELRLYKSTRNRWMVEVWIAEELFYYSYPFLLPDLRKRKLKYAFEVQFYILQTFSCIGIEKVFFIEEFFTRYPSAISHRTMTYVKREFLMWVETLEKSDLIEKQYKIIQRGQYYSVSQLTIDNISEGFVLYEKILMSPSS